MGKIQRSVINFDDLTQAIRSGGCSLMLSDLSAENIVLSEYDHCSFFASDDTAEIILRQMNPEKISFDLEDTIITSFGSVDATIDGHLRVRIGGVYQGNAEYNTAAGASMPYNFQKVYLVANQPEVSERGIILAKIAQNKVIHRNFKSISDEEAKRYEKDVHKRYKPLGIRGTFKNYEYWIRQDHDLPEDTVILVFLKEGATSTPEQDEVFYECLLEAFNWMNGGKSYPYSYKHMRGENIYKSWVCAKQTSSDRDEANNYLFHRAPFDYNIEPFFTAFIEYAHQKRDMLPVLKNLLWQYREATIRGTITYNKLLHACALLEGLIRIILKHHNGRSKNYIENTLKSVRERFEEAVLSVGFSWLEFEPVFVNWKKARNKLAHGDLEAIRNWESGFILKAYPQIIQAFNNLLLKMIGFPHEKTLLNGRWFTVPPAVTPS